MRAIIPVRWFSRSVKLQNKLAALKQLEDFYKDEKVVMDDRQDFKLPEGVSRKFFEVNNALVESLKKNEKMRFDRFEGLLDVLDSKEEQELLKKTALEWLDSGRMFSFKTTGPLINILLKAEKHELLFTLLSQRFRYQLHPESKDFTKLIGSYAERHLQDPANIEWLDLMYKYFAILLYYDIPPTIHNYHQLIAAGLYGQSEEGIKRSLKTIKEVKSLGWELPLKTKVAIAYNQFKQKDFDGALLLVSEFEETKFTLLMKIEILLGLDLVPNAIDLTKKLEAAPKHTFDRHDSALKYWKSQVEVLEMVKQAAQAKGINFE